MSTATFTEQTPDGFHQTATSRGGQAGRDAGEKRKQDRLDLLRARRAVYVRHGQRALIQRLLEVGRATADDVREAVELPPGIDPVCFGAVPNCLARAGIIERVGFVPTARPDAHARPVSVWALRDRAKATRWLEQHPELSTNAVGVDSVDRVERRQQELFPLH